MPIQKYPSLPIATKKTNTMPTHKYAPPLPSHHFQKLINTIPIHKYLPPHPTPCNWLHPLNFICIVRLKTPGIRKFMFKGLQSTFLERERTRFVCIYIYIVRTRKFWNRKTTFRINLWLLIVQYAWDTEIVLFKQTHFT